MKAAASRKDIYSDSSLASQTLSGVWSTPIVELCNLVGFDDVNLIN